MALYASVEVQPLAAYFGGVVAQEVVKVAGKYTPLNQWLHLDFLEMLPEEFPEDGRRKPGDGEGDRYEHVVRLFGEKFFREKIMNAKTFMVSVCACVSAFLSNCTHLRNQAQSYSCPARMHAANVCVCGGAFWFGGRGEEGGSSSLQRKISYSLSFRVFFASALVVRFGG